jgi:hypothetical protein
MVACLTLLAAGCASSAGDASDSTTTRSESTTTETAPSLDEQIRTAWEGVQLGGSEAAGRALFFHDGTWAAEMYERGSDDWCLRAVYEWSVTAATSDSSFVIDYDVLEEPDDCLPSGAPRFVLAVSGANQQGGQTVYEGSYTEPFALPVTRTVCASRWDEPTPCGIDIPESERPAPPGQ